MKKPLDKQNKVCYNKYTKKDLWGGHAPARGWIKGRKRLKPTPQINHNNKFFTHGQNKLFYTKARAHRLAPSLSFVAGFRTQPLLTVALQRIKASKFFVEILSSHG